MGFESKGEPFITTAVFHSYLITIPQSHKKNRTEEPVNPQDVWSGTAVRIHVCVRETLPLQPQIDFY